MNTPALLSTLRALELALHTAEVRADIHRLGSLLHPHFREFGRSGDRYDRADVLREFAGAPPSYRVWSQDFALDLLSEQVALLTYRSAHVTEDGRLERHALRASLWQRTDSGWQMRFHQGTPCGAFARADP
jgi:hypothetical protein